MSTIKQLQQRDWMANKFTGELLNFEGKKDTGGNFMDYRYAVLERCKSANCAQILSDSKAMPLMSTAVKLDLTNRLQQLESRVPMSDNLREKAQRIRKTITEETIRKEKVDAQAAKVLTIMEELSAPNIVQHMRQTMKPHKANHEAALSAVLEVQHSLYFDKPFRRKEQADDQLNQIGVAHSAPQLLMLILQLLAVFDHVRDWFYIEDTDDLYDVQVPFYNDAQMVRILLQRISSKSNEMLQYRTLVLKCITKDDSFAEVTDAIKNSLMSDEPSLDAEPSNRQTSNAFAAQLNQGHSKQESQYQQQMAFQAGVDFGTQQADKKQRTEGFKPYASAQPNSRTSTLCHYWDGRSCDYETVRHLPCRYVDSHIIGVSSFKGPYIVKNDNSHAASFEEYQQWMKGREQLSSK